MKLLSLASLLTAALLLSDASAADAPSVSSFFPGGGRAGESVDVEAKGSFKSWPVEARVDRDGITFLAGEEPGNFTAEIADDASPGIYWVRLFNEDGASSLRPFIVGTLPEVREAEPNDSDPEAQEVDPQGVVITGRLDQGGVVDALAVPLDPAQTLVASIEAHDRLGSPMDAVLQIVSPEGFVIDHVDDSPTFDPKLAFSAPTGGTYLVRVFAFPSDPDSSIRFSGGADYVYRLTLTTGDLIDLAHPSAIHRENTAPEISGIGWSGADELAPLHIDRFPDAGGLAWHPDRPGFAVVNVVDSPVVPAVNDPDNPVTLPALICGRVAAEGARERFWIEAEPGATVALRVEARSFSSPLDPVIRVEDASGEQLADQDDSGKSRDPELTVKVPGDGKLVVELRDLHRRGGPRYLYRVEARELTPEVALTIDSDNVVGSTENPISIPVVIDRRGGFKGRVTIAVEGLPEGVSVEPVISEPEGDSSKKVTLELRCEGAAPWSGEIRFTGTIEGEDDPERSLKVALTERIGGPPTSAIWLTIAPKP